MSGETPVTSLTTRAKAVRVLVTLIAGVLLVLGTFWGEDDHFPFGPFKMFASAEEADSPTVDTRLEATDAEGRTVLLTVRNTGIRRAEIEGQRDQIVQTPKLLQATVDAYHRRNPAAPPLQEVRVVIRWHEVRDFQPTGEWEDEVVATWQP